MRKNLFDYATKELSQDAFLRWFLSNYDDDQIGPIVADFISYFSKNQDGNRTPLNLNAKDIKKIETKSQVNNIDVSVDIWSDSFKGHRTIVIEDKTYSEEHNQLKKYNTKIASWEYEEELTPAECVYKVFYKIHAIDKAELQRVKDAGWTPFDIEKIYDFFISYLNKTDSEILNNYILYVKEIYESYRLISPKPAKEWSYINWETFFHKFMESFEGIEHRFSTYHGIYNMMLIYFYLPKNKFLTYVAFEIQIRGCLKAYLHPGFHVKNDSWEWSTKPFKGEPILDECNKELDELRNYVQNYGSKIIKRSNTSRAFGKIKEVIELDIYSDELSKLLSSWVIELKNIIDSYNKAK